MHRLAGIPSGAAQTPLAVEAPVVLQLAQVGAHRQQRDARMPEQVLFELGLLELVEPYVEPKNTAIIGHLLLHCLPCKMLTAPDPIMTMSGSMAKGHISYT